jgi:hypothetical protein
MKTKKNANMLDELVLRGFQTFADTAELPLGKLTFLFGPNSAGKSSVEDALKLLPKITDINDFSVTGLNGFDRIGKEYRRISDQPIEYAPSLLLGLVLSASPERFCWHESPSEIDRALAVEYMSKRKLHHIRYISDFPQHEDESFVDSLTRLVGHQVEIEMNDLPLLSISMQHHVGLNISHPLIKAMGLFCDAKAKDISSLHGVVELKKGWIWFFGGLQIKEGLSLENLFSLNDGHSKKLTEAFAIFPEFRPAIKDILYVVLSLVNQIKPTFVEASRKIPTPEDLLFVSTAFDDGFQDLIGKFPLNTRGDVRYRELAESLISPETTDHSDCFDSHNRCTSDLGKRVNEMMSEHLFIERGYRVAADYRLLISGDQFDRLEGGAESNLTRGDYAVITRLFLMDSQGREFSFPEVGSGLGYVLPVLVSVCDQSSISVIQQPELHLHPALQAALGDVFIEACNHGKQVIVETHSEHVLLRVLKRIRQSASGKGIAEGLSINPDDVSVLYFDPSPDGTTKVKRLRISPDGDFLDRWPRGFFGERDAELFDE